MKNNTAFDALAIKDNERLPYIAESAVWESIITPAIVEYLTCALPALLMIGPHAVQSVNQVLCESIYVLGYHEGAKHKQPRLTFFCPEEETNERT